MSHEPRADVNTSPRGIAISYMYGPDWNPGRLGPLLTELYDAGCIRHLGGGRFVVVHHGKPTQRDP